MSTILAPSEGSSPQTLPLKRLITANSKGWKHLYTDVSPTSGRKRRRPEVHDPDVFQKLREAEQSHRLETEYSHVQVLPASLATKQQSSAPVRKSQPNNSKTAGDSTSTSRGLKLLEYPEKDARSELETGNVPLPQNRVADRRIGANDPNKIGSTDLIRASAPRYNRPKWHAPWKLMRVISGHLGWVRSLAVEPGNKWFASGSGDRTIKIWDLATGSLRLTLTGHISTVRGLAVSARHPYLFSAGEDKMVKCWDLETNKVIRHYHGHLSGVYALSLHPSLDVLVTGGRDGVARVWDMRTRSNVQVLSGHSGTISDVRCQDADPQVISASLDTTVRLWDLAAGKAMGILTHHKKGVRALAIHPTETTFATGSTGSIKQWQCPEGAFMQNFEGHNAIINSLSVNAENVLFSGGDNGSMSFWDWKTGYRFQSLDTTAQPGSLDAEAGVMSSVFDHSGMRLICGEADKTIKVWRQDAEATEETHPVVWNPTATRRRF